MDRRDAHGRRERRPRRLGVIAGSGMAALGDAFVAETIVPFAAIDGVGECTVAGHAGQVRWCTHAGSTLAVVLGRRHFYEGEPDAMRPLMQYLCGRGVSDVVVVSAAGSLRGDVSPGEFVVVVDAVDLQNRARFLHGASRSADGEVEAAGRGPSRLRVDPGLACALEDAALAAGVMHCRGILACHAGPTYETPAEVGMSQFAGASLVTMSAASELVMANALGTRVAALAAITNPATGISRSAPNHGEVLDRASRASAGLARIIAQLIENEFVSKSGGGRS